MDDDHGPLPPPKKRMCPTRTQYPEILGHKPIPYTPETMEVDGMSEWHFLDGIFWMA